MKDKLIQSIFTFLNEKVNYAVLRNYDGLPQSNCGRDIDILVDRHDFKVNKNKLCDIIKENGFFITTLYKSDKMYALMCLNAKGEVAHFDFLFDTSLHGVIFLTSKEVLSNRQFNGSVYHVSLEYEFLDKYLYLKSLNVCYPQKYASTKDAVFARNSIDDIVARISCYKSYSDLDSKSSIMFMCSMFLYNLRHRPVRQMKQIVKNCYYNIINRFLLSGLSIAYTGADGVGKTTVIDKITSIFNTTASVHLYHHRPTVIGNIGEVANKAGLKKTVDREYDKPHRATKKGFVSSMCRLSYYTMDYILGYWARIRKQLYKRNVIIFDRYFTDVIVDSRRSSIYLNTKFLYGWGKLLIPKMKYNILLTADPDVILSRKQELDREGIVRINTKMEYLASKKDYYMVMNNGTAEEAVEKILTIIIDGQHTRNLKRI